MFTDLFPINWDEFHFLRPEFLWLILPSGLILLLGLLNLKQSISWKGIIAPHLRTYVIQKGSNRTKLIMHSVSFFGLVFGSLALAGPTWKKIEIPGQELQTSMIILLDLGESMLQDDIEPNRLERAKFKIEDLLDQDPIAKTGLIVFSGSAHTVVPLTEDYQIIKSHIETLNPEIMPLKGNNLKEAIHLSDSLLTKTEAPGTLVIFSDKNDEESFDILSEFSLTSENSIEWIPIQAMGNNDEASQSAQDFIQKIETLDGISTQLLTLDNSDMEKISDQIKTNLSYQEEPEEKEDDWRDAGLLLIIPLAAILLVWFRKGWVIYGLILFVFTSCGRIHSFEDLWYTLDYQGQRQFDKSNWEAAAEKFTDPLRKGVAYYKAGNFDQAIAAFQQDSTAQGAYNLGLAYIKNGQFDAANLAFQEAIEKDPSMNEALQNQELLGQIKDSSEFEIDPKDAQEAESNNKAQNIENKDPEDLGGGGQEATDKDMETERKEETVTTDMRTAKELDEVPDDLSLSEEKMDPSKVLMRKTDDDPSLFLEKKFAFQLKKRNKKPNPDE
jgi:Ca-activated chloride channel family protein